MVVVGARRLAAIQPRAQASFKSTAFDNLCSGYERGRIPMYVQSCVRKSATPSPSCGRFPFPHGESPLAARSTRVYSPCPWSRMHTACLSVLHTLDSAPQLLWYKPQPAIVSRICRTPGCTLEAVLLIPWIANDAIQILDCFDCPCHHSKRFVPFPCSRQGQS